MMTPNNNKVVCREEEALVVGVNYYGTDRERERERESLLMTKLLAEGVIYNAAAAVIVVNACLLADL